MFVSENGNVEILGDLNVGGKVNTKELCIEDACINNEQLKKLLEGV